MSTTTPHGRVTSANYLVPRRHSPSTRRQPVGVEDANLRSRSKHTHFSVHPGTWPTVGLHTSVSACSVHSAQLHSAFCKMWVDMWWTPPVEVGSRARHVPWTLAAPSFLLRHTRSKVNRRKRQVPGHGSTNVISLDLWPPVSSCLNCLACTPRFLRSVHE